MRSLGTVLGVWAHPDDETYCSGGLMALARSAGERVVVVTATRGERGTADPHRWPPGVLGRHREAELAEALRRLGVDEHVQLGLADGSLDRYDAALASAMIGHVVREVRPDTIVTFGPDGITGHPDHRAVSLWARQAWRLAAPHARLLYAAVTHVDEIDEELGVHQPGYPVLTAPHDVALALSLHGDVLARKRAALAAHASQTDALAAALGEERYLSWIENETFRDPVPVRSSRRARRLRRPRRRAGTHPVRAAAGR